MAQKKAAGSTKNGRDSVGKRLGIKKFGSEYVIPGNILVRQRGTKVKPGINVKCGRDYTLYSISYGYVFFKKIKNIMYINVINKNY